MKNVLEVFGFELSLIVVVTGALIKVRLNLELKFSGL